MGSFGSGGLGTIGAFTEHYGNMKADQEESRAHRRNANFYREQAEWARQAMLRELEIYDDQSATFTGEQISQIGSGGVDMSGSPILAMADTFWRQAREREAIMFDGGIKQREANLKAAESDRAADWLNNTERVVMKQLGGFVNIVSQGATSSKGSLSGKSSGGMNTSNFTNSRGAQNPSSAAKYWSTA